MNRSHDLTYSPLGHNDQASLGLAGSGRLG
jgi:hypothetical protein